MVRIRLARVGRKKSPAYRVVVADSHKARDGRFIEILGYYQPVPTETKVQLNDERAVYWMSHGAVPSDTVKSLFRKAGILKKFHESRKPAPSEAAA